MAAPRRSLRRLLKRLVLWLPLIFLLVLFLAHTITHVPWDAKLFGGFKPATIDANARQVGLALAYLVQTFLAAGFIIYLSGSVGTLILPRLDGFEVLERAALRSLSGLAVLSVSGLVLGMLGLYPPSGVLWGLMVAFNVALWFRWGRVWWSDLRVGISEAWAVDGGFYRWLKWGVAALLAIAFLLALPPPTKWDAMTYHLAGPAKYLAVGRVIGYPENHFLGFPQLVETLFTWAMLMIGPQAAVLILLVSDGNEQHGSDPSVEFGATPSGRAPGPDATRCDQAPGASLPGAAASPTPNSRFTESRIRMMMVKTPRTVPKGMNMQDSPAITRQKV